MPSSGGGRTFRAWLVTPPCSPSRKIYKTPLRSLGPRRLLPHPQDPRLLEAPGPSSRNLAGEAAAATVAVEDAIEPLAQEECQEEEAEGPAPAFPHPSPGKPFPTPWVSVTRGEGGRGLVCSEVTAGRTHVLATS